MDGHRRSRRWAALAAACALLLAAAPARAQSANDGFDPGCDGRIYAIAIQADGRIVVGGEFTLLGGGGTGHTPRRNIGRLNPDGSVDASFNPGADGIVYALGIQPDGKILAGGAFTAIGGGTGVTARNFLARLNADGSVDGLNPGMSGEVYALAVQRDGKILAAGFFTSVGSGASAAVRRRIARFQPDGSLDASFNPGAENTIQAMVLQPDGKILVGGTFDGLGGGDGSTERQRIGRLRPDGSVDSFNPGANSGVYSLAIQADGRIVVGGGFTMIGGGGTGTTPRNRLARLTPDGTVDAFDPNVSARVVALAIQPDGRIVVGGQFLQVGVLIRPYLARLDPNGALDDTFSGGTDFPVDTLTGDAIGRTLVGGAFSTVSGATRHGIARMYADGLDTTLQFGFSPGDLVRAIAVQPDRRIIIAGSFTVNDGFSSCVNLCRITADGFLDRDFSQFNTPNNSVNSIALQRDGRIIVGGYFSALGGTPRARIARLRADGAVDGTFDAGTGPSDGVWALALQSDGRVLIGGDFAFVGGQPHGHIARLQSDGTLDSAFTYSVNGRVAAIAVQSDDKIVVGGNFTLPHQYLMRLQPAGFGIEIDPSFDPGASDGVLTLAIQPDGKIVVGGNFVGLGGGDGRIQRVHIGRLNPDGTVDSFDPGANAAVLAIAAQADGTLMIGGSFTGVGGTYGTTPRSHLARVAADGRVDAWTTDVDGFVYAICLGADGKPMIAGAFTTVGSGPAAVARAVFARLSSAEAPAESIDVTGTSVTWRLNAVMPQLSAVTFELSTDGVTYTTLGTASGILGGWQLGGLALPTVQPFFVRARGVPVSGVYFGGARSIVEYVRAAYLPPQPAALTRIVLDAPRDGATVKGLVSVSGWALNEAALVDSGVDAVHVYATDGGTLQFVGVATYGAPRNDVAALYGAQFTSSGFALDAVALTPGVHTLVAYAHNSVSGIFDAIASATITVAPPLTDPHIAVDYPTPGLVVTSAFEVAGWALDAGSPTGTGVDSVQFYIIPAGASAGVFIGTGSYGKPRADLAAIYGPRFTNCGFHFTITGLGPGAYTLSVLAHSTVTGSYSIIQNVPVTVSATALMSIDAPSPEQNISASSFLVGGWSIDRNVESTGPTGTGVDALHIYAYPNPGSGQPAIFLGVATMGVARPDVGAAYGSRYNSSGYSLIVDRAAAGLAPGVYNIVVASHSSVSGTFNNLAVVQITLQ